MYETGDAPVADQEQVLAVLGVRRRSRSCMSPCRRARSACRSRCTTNLWCIRVPSPCSSAGRLGLERLRHVLGQGCRVEPAGRCRPASGGRVAADPCGPTCRTTKMCRVLRHVRDRVADGPVRLVEERERIEDARRRVLSMSSPTDASRAFAAACGENDTWASIPARPRSRQRVESVSPKPTTESFAQYASNASWKTATAALAAQHDRVVRLDVQPAPAEVRRSADDDVARRCPRRRSSCCAGGCSCAGA